MKIPSPTAYTILRHIKYIPLTMFASSKARMAILMSSQTQSLPTVSQTLPPINDTITTPILFNPTEDDDPIPSTELPPETNIPDHVSVLQSNPALGPVPDMSLQRSSHGTAQRDGGGRIWGLCVDATVRTLWNEAGRMPMEQDYGCCHKNGSSCACQANLAFTTARMSRELS